MSAFKAANPGCCLEDFVRWHSPRDWIEQESRLSDRMATTDNLWKELWSMADEHPACEQKPLFDFKKEAEKVLSYLETIPLEELIRQLLLTAFAITQDLFLPIQGLILKDPFLRNLMMEFEKIGLVPMEETLNVIQNMEQHLSKSLSILHKVCFLFML